MTDHSDGSGGAARTVLVLGDGQGRSYDCGTMRAVFKADGEETNDAYSISEWWLEPGSEGPGTHVHDANDDIFYVLTGRLTFVLDGEQFTAGTGSFVRVPAGVQHVRLLNIYWPGGFEQEMPSIAAWFAGAATP